MKSLRKLLLGSIICLALVIGTAAPMRNVEAEDNDYVTKQYSAETEIAEENRVPYYTDENGEKDDNYLFAGWYSDADCADEDSLPAFKDGCYAKFVDREVLTVAMQLKKGTTHESDLTAIKFLTSVDSDNYKKVGFTVDIQANGESVIVGGNALDVQTMDVYKTVNGYTKDEEGTLYTPEEIFSKASTYFAGYELTEIANLVGDYAYNEDNQFTWTFVITPYWMTYDDVTVNGLTKTFEIHDLLCEAEIDELKSEDGIKHVWYPILEEALDEAQANNAASVVTILNDVEINGTLEVTQTLTLQSRKGVDITITRGVETDSETENDYTYNMLQNMTTNRENVVSIQAGIDDYGNGSLTFDSYSRPETYEDADGNEKERQERLACNVIRNDNDDDRNSEFNNTIGKLIIGEKVCITRHEAYAESTGVSSAIYNSGELILSCEMYDNNTSQSNSPITNDCGAVLTIEGGLYWWNIGSSDKGGVLHNCAGAEATIRGGIFKNNRGGYGGLAYNAEGATLTIEDGQFNENYSTHKYGAGLVRNYSATLTINGGSYKKNYTEQDNGGVIVQAQKADYDTAPQATINGGTFESNHGAHAGVVYNESSTAILTIEDGTFNGNYATSTSSAGVIKNGGTATINGGKFDSNHGAHAGVVYNSKTLTITSGDFNKNYATNETSTLYCGGVIYNTNTLIIDDGNFTYNYATGIPNGCGVIYNTKSVTLNGGTYTGNYGGTGKSGVLYMNGGTGTITGGTFKYNHSGRGGVIYNGSSAKLNITGGTFDSNYATNYGGGVVENNGSSLTIAGTSGSPVTMTNNYCTQYDDGSSYGGGAILHSNGAKLLEISNCDIYGNSGDKVTADITVAQTNKSTACASVLFKDDTFKGTIRISKQSASDKLENNVVNIGKSADSATAFNATVDEYYYLDWTNNTLTTAE